jgi:hypothetical protein
VTCHPARVQKRGVCGGERVQDPVNVLWCRAATRPKKEKLDKVLARVSTLRAFVYLYASLQSVAGVVTRSLHAAVHLLGGLRGTLLMHEGCTGEMGN